MYASNRPDVLRKYRQPADYATAMLPWITAIKTEWPNAQVALIGVAATYNLKVPRVGNWNQQVLHSTAEAKVDAATLHIYCSWDANKNSAGQLAIAASSAFSNGDYFRKTIPSHMRIWVTEMGVTPAGSLDGTWLHALCSSLRHCPHSS